MQKKAPLRRAVLLCDLVYKPGSVLTAIYLAPQLLTGSSHLLGTAGPACMSLHGVAPNRVYIVKPMSPWAEWALTPLFHPYFPKKEKRYLSVALVLRSPSAGVTRYSCPVKPGLSSSAAFRLASAAVRPGRWNIVQQRTGIVKHLEKSFRRGYTIYRKIRMGEMQ